MIDKLNRLWCKLFNHDIEIQYKMSNIDTDDTVKTRLYCTRCGAILTDWVELL